MNLLGGVENKVVRGVSERDAEVRRINGKRIDEEIDKVIRKI